MHGQGPVMGREPDSVVQKEMGQRLQLVRDALGVTQEDFAKEAGVGLSAISAWEGGRNKIDVVKLRKLADTYGFSTDYIIRNAIDTLTFGLAKKVQLQIELHASEAPPRRGRPRAAQSGIPPPRPPMGGNVGKNRAEVGCQEVITIVSGARRAG